MVPTEPYNFSVEPLVFPQSVFFIFEKSDKIKSSPFENTQLAKSISNIKDTQR